MRCDLCGEHMDWGTGKAFGETCVDCMDKAASPAFLRSLAEWFDCDLDHEMAGPIEIPHKATPGLLLRTLAEAVEEKKAELDKKTPCPVCNGRIGRCDVCNTIYRAEID